MSKEAIKYITATLAAFGPDEAISMSKETWARLREAIKTLAEQPAQQQNGPINEGWQITVAHGHSGYGVYAHMEDYPEEGAVLVQAIEQPAQQQQPVALKVDEGELRYKSQEDDQSFGMWCSVTPNSNLPFSEGTKFYTSPPASKTLTDELAVLRLVSEEYNAWIHAHAGGGSYDEFLKQRLAAHGIKENT